MSMGALHSRRGGGPRGRGIPLRQVKNRLSYYLRRVKEGELVEVTDRGRVVAQLVQPRRRSRSSDREARFGQLEREGTLTRGTGRMEDVEPLKPLKPTRLSKMILEDRR